MTRPAPKPRRAPRPAPDPCVEIVIIEPKTDAERRENVEARARVVEILRRLLR